ncbi:MAG: iron(III) transport system substrate-binding protein [bacterium]|jgi:iron(III) transport system substrate-binding protein
MSSKMKLTTLLVVIFSLIAFDVFAGSKVNVYSARQEFLMRPFLNVFEKNTGIKVNVVYMKKGLLERLKAEGRNTPADLVLTVDIANLTKIAKSGVLQKYRSNVVNQNIPKSFRDSKGLWTGLTARSRILYYSKKRVKISELSTYEALANKKFRGRICVRSGLHNYNIALLSSVIAHKGKKQAEKWARGVRKNLAYSPRGNDRAQVKAIAHGVCDIAIGNSYYMGKMLENSKQRDWAAAVSIFYPNQKGRGTHINISGGAITKYAQNKRNARKLLEFLTGDLAQSMYANVNHEYPLKKGTPYSGIVKSFGSGQKSVKKGKFKWDTIGLSKVGSYRKEAIKIMHRVGWK